jgi:hypothetical protein
VAFDSAGQYVRLVILLIGITMGLTCLRFALLAWRDGQRPRMFGILSYGCCVSAPAINGLRNLDQPLFWPGATLYLIGLLLGLTGLTANYTFSPNWLALRSAATPEEDDPHG